jgi:hypothetical protein
MQTTAAAIAIFAGIFLAIGLSLLPLILSADKAEQEKARARRMTDHRMNARLLRLNL